MNTNVFRETETEEARELRERNARAEAYIERAEREQRLGLFERLTAFLLRFGLMLFLMALVVRVAV